MADIHSELHECSAERHTPDVESARIKDGYDTEDCEIVEDDEDHDREPSCFTKILTDVYKLASLDNENFAATWYTIIGNLAELAARDRHLFSMALRLVIGDINLGRGKDSTFTLLSKGHVQLTIHEQLEEGLAERLGTGLRRSVEQSPASTSAEDSDAAASNSPAASLRANSISQSPHAFKQAERPGFVANQTSQQPSAPVKGHTRQGKGPRIFSADHPTIIELDDHWTEIWCHICGANCGANGKYFVGARGLCLHIRGRHTNHTPKTFNMKDAIGICGKYSLSDIDIDNLFQQKVKVKKVVAPRCKGEIAASASALKRARRIWPSVNSTSTPDVTAFLLNEATESGSEQGQENRMPQQISRRHERRRTDKTPHAHPQCERCLRSTYLTISLEEASKCKIFSDSEDESDD